MHGHLHRSTMVCTDWCTSAVYCAVITHDESKNNGFTECADDTMNPGGKGNYEGHEQKGHHHRKLIKRIDLH